MKVYLLAPTLAACAALSTTPVVAHHNSPMDVEIPYNAELVHNAAIESVLDRLEDMDQGMGSGTVEMDPSTQQAGSRCSWVEDPTDCATASSEDGAQRDPIEWDEGAPPYGNSPPPSE